MIRWPVGATLTVLLAGGLTACSGDVEPDKASQTRVEAGDRYVAIGDSYTSGPSIGDASGSPGCEQTTGNYPHLVAAALDLDLVDVSCGGAATVNLNDPQTPPNGTQVPPQLDAVTEDADLVTISLGGNDGNMFGNLVINCVALARSDPDGAPCSTLAVADDVLDTVIAELGDNLAEGVDAVRARAPRARVLVVGYPQIFPKTGTCDELPRASGDYPFARQVMQRIAGAQEAAAERAGVEYVDMWDATEGHDICADEPWIAGMTPAGRALFYHPYAEGQQAVADALAARVGD